MKGELPSLPRWITILLQVSAVIGVIAVGVLAVKRAVNGNADLSGNHKLWRANLTAVTVPVRREGAESQDPDSYPPITYAIYAPLGALPLWATSTLWTALNLACSVYLWREALEWLHSRSGLIPERAIIVLGRTITLWPETQVAQVVLALAVVAVIPSWVGGVLLGQNTLILMCLTWGAFQASRRHKPWLAGGLLALATVLKVFPVVFLLPFVLRWNIRVLTAYALTGIILVLGLGSLYFGPRQNIDHHLRWLQFAARGPVDRPADPRDPNSLRGSLRYHNQSIEAVLARLLMDVPITNQPDAPRVNFQNVSAETWRRTRSATSGLLVILGLFTLYRSASSPAALKQPGCCPETSVEIYALLSVLQLFVSPIVWSHYYVWLFWPLLLVLVLAQQGRRAGYVIYLAWLAALPLIAVPQIRAVGLHLWMTVVIFVWICWQLAGERGVSAP